MFYPLFIELRNRPVLVVGGGPIAERKVDSLLQAEAAVTLVAPDLTAHLKQLAAAGSIRTERRKFEEADLENVLLVISATDDVETQERVAALARAHGILINTVDQPRLCDFIVPAVVRHGDVIAAISTSGKSPALAAALKSKIESVVTKDAVARQAFSVQSVMKFTHGLQIRRDARMRSSELLTRAFSIGSPSSDDAAALQKVCRMIEGLQ
jgi:siroheme synthase-like protein